jgi:hypothetical protein
VPLELIAGLLGHTSTRMLDIPTGTGHAAPATPLSQS